MLLAHFSKPENKWSKIAAYQHYINLIRKDFQWYSEVSSRVTRKAIDDLDNAFIHFFRRLKLKQKAGFPRFKKKDVIRSGHVTARPKMRIRAESDCGFIHSFCVDGVNKPENHRFYRFS